MEISMAISISRFFFFLVFLASSTQNSTAQSAITDPSEVRALNSIFQQWNIKSNVSWNISGNPCSGSSVDDSASEAETVENNPTIKCDCSYDYNRTCHITQLRVQALEIHGVIPQELTALKHLQVFKIDENYFTGTLPAFMGNLTKLTILSISRNSFCGSLPKELGNLKRLQVLSPESNFFSGTLPLELGNLINLQKLYLDSSGIGGEIPSTFVNLRNMKLMSGSDCPFSGKIPEFIGNWTSLTSLIFQGTSLQGPIPSSFSQLTALETLKIGDLNSGSSTLDFVIPLKNLTVLILRNALIGGPIPSQIGDFQHLRTLDLSFNSLTGEIPSSLFNMTSLSSLFLGNNSLYGSLPLQRSRTLQHIDVSYNLLSGRFPPWVTSISQLNLVANNFVFDGSNISVIPQLYCLQRNFPCNRDPPLYSDFAINCGGPEVKVRSGTVYESENLYLGPAKFYKTSEKWAVSKVGIYTDTTCYLNRENTTIKVTSANESRDLFSTSRMSPGSLRYYGLGLQNGPYTVTLQFAEISLPNLNSERSPGPARRVFDIYVQGRLEERDFNIAKEAGGVEIAVEKKYNVMLTENYLEVHLFWSGKGTCCVPKEGYYGPSIAALHVTPDFKPTLGISSISRNESKKGLIVGITGPLMVVVFVFLFVIMYRKKKVHGDDEDLRGISNHLTTFTYSELKTATSGFSASNKLGEGGYGLVYKGTLSDGRIVAVKQISVASSHVKRQFVAEIATISVVQHRNLAKLLGCCVEGKNRILVYEYHVNRSLDQALFGKSKLHLEWPARFNICLGTAKGLAYLHEESRPRVIHRDVKASNILLDENLAPKLSDFGLAKLYDESKTHMSTRVAGTIGYLAPEYALRGQLTEKADVFGFGVVALEVISGKPNIIHTSDGETISLLELAWTLHENDRSSGLVDPRLAEFDEHEVMKLIRVALLCTQASSMLRPTMSHVVAMLSGDAEIDTTISRPGYLTELGCRNIQDDNATVPAAVRHDPMFPSPYSVSELPHSDVITKGR